MTIFNDDRFLGRLVLLGLVVLQATTTSTVSAQFLNHYQSLYDFDGNNAIKIGRFDTKALTPVDESYSFNGGGPYTQLCTEDQKYTPDYLLALSDKDLWELGLNGGVGKCRISRSTGSACNYYVMSSPPSATTGYSGVPRNNADMGTGCVDEDGGFCYYTNTAYPLSAVERADMCTTDKVGNAAAQLRYGIKNDYCCDKPSSIIRPPEVRWAFASTVQMGNDPGVQTLLVKLKGNTPNTNPFAFEWARLYQTADNVQLDVEDVYHELPSKSTDEDEGGYILCGKATFGNTKESRAFLLRVTNMGFVIQAKTYKLFHIFKSVVPSHDGQGYIAVGQTTTVPTVPPSKHGRSAAYASIQKTDLKLICNMKFNPTFDQNKPKESGLNKVIQYTPSSFSVGQDKDFWYAFTGEAINNYRNKCENKKELDAIVGVGNGSCEFKYVKKYGGKKKKLQERGLSIAQVTSSGKLAITGNVKTWKNCNQPPRVDDILTFVLKTDGNLQWWKRYDVQQGSDFGTALQRSTFDGSRILIGGETTTNVLINNATKTTKDAFLMSVNKNNGNYDRFEVFGFEYGTNNGALAPGNLDLHLTRDDHAVMMGNTDFPELSPYNPDRKFPYLIERYETVTEQCVDKPIEVKVKGYLTKVVDIGVDELVLEEEKMDVTDEKRTLQVKRRCEKTPLSEVPSTSPSNVPTDVPTASPTFLPSTFMPSFDVETEFPTGHPTPGDDVPLTDVPIKVPVPDGIKVIRTPIKKDPVNDEPVEDLDEEELKKLVSF